ncbi:hypothetical protein QYF61_019748 [Mycteria americana]|uniref:Uncharacterized protein n=1 Tax=Mycteria americana TaxID=33587 RepID=A0AAN7N9H1_MYCAM|nr:hypothetical protein QYF61_019748 [Mycteria americana]
MVIAFIAGRHMERCSSPLIIFVALFWTCSNKSMSFLCWGPQNWTQYSRWGLTTVEWRGRITSLNLLATLHLYAAQDAIGFLGCKRTLPAHVLFFIHQYPQVLLCRAAPNPFIPQPVLILEVAPSQEQDLAFGLVELHEVCMGPPPKPVKVPLDGIPSLRHVNHTTQLGVIHKLAEGAFNPTVYAKQPQFPQLLLIRLLLQTLHQLRCPSLDTLQHLNVSLVVRGPKPNTVFKVQPHQCQVQGDNHFPSPAGHTIFDTSQDAICLLGHLGTLLAHIQPAVDQHLQVLFCLAAFHPLFPKPVALHGVVVTQVQDPALSFDEPHTIGPSPLIQPVQVPLQSLPTLKQINTPAQLGVICKLTEGALEPFVQIIDKDIKQNWPQHRALGDTTCDQLPNGFNSIHHNSLGPASQTGFFTPRRVHPSKP